jgi:hypothetical protein
MAVTITSISSWNVMSYSLVEVYWRFGVTYCFHVQGQNVR